jgi:3-dehydroquinate dehydratase-2
VPRARARSRKPRILVVHGPNLNLLGKRRPEVYGKATLAEINASIRAEAKKLGAAVTIFQSNGEGEILDRLHRAVEACGFPTVEVHLSNIYGREAFRHRSRLAPVCLGQVTGFGPQSYRLGLLALIEALHAGG